MKVVSVCQSCLVMVERLFHAVPRGCLQFVIVVFPDHTHLLFLHIQLNHLYEYNMANIYKKLVTSFQS